MQKVDAAKIVLALKWRWAIATALVLVLLVIALAWANKPSSQPTSLIVNGKQITLMVSKTPQQLETGLGNRASLPPNEGMLFVFNVPAVQCFWMKDMHFPIDIIWLSSVKQIVYIQGNVSPNTYPESFCPPNSAQYVIELNSGQAHALQLEVGQALKF